MDEICAKGPGDPSDYSIYTKSLRTTTQ